MLIHFSDSLHENCEISDGLWNDLRKHFSEEAMLELLMLAGFYRTVSYLTNVIQIPLENFGTRFPVKQEKK